MYVILVLVLPLIAFRNPSECNNIMYYDVQVRHSCSSPLLAFRNPSENRKILSHCCLRTASDSLYSALNTISTTTIRGGPTNLHLLELSYSTYANFRIFYKIQTLKLKKATWPRPLLFIIHGQSDLQGTQLRRNGASGATLRLLLLQPCWWSALFRNKRKIVTASDFSTVFTAWAL
jgi:hypothetical protein